MSNTAEALAALHAAEAELEAALAAENAVTADVDADVKTAPEVDASIKPAAPDATASSVPGNVSGPHIVTAKYLDMGPGYLGPTAINGT